MNRSGTPNQSRLPPNSSASHHDASYNVALKGASLAFQKKPPKPIPTPATSNRNVNNGALIAATSASRDHNLSSSPAQAQASRISRQTTGSSVQGGNNGQEYGQGQHLQPTQQQSHLAPPNRPTLPDPRSPSFIAATLAASRSGSPSPRPVAQSHPYGQKAARRRRKGSIGANSAASSVTSLDLATDTASIPPTNALISMFEKKDDDEENDDDTDPVRLSTPVSSTKNTPGAKPKLRSVTPSRTLSPVTKHDTSPSRLASSLAWERATTPPASVKDTAREISHAPPNTSFDHKKRPPTPPPARSKVEVDVAPNPQALESRGKPRATTPPPRPISRANTVILSPQPRRVSTQKIISDESIEPPFKDNSRKPPVKPKPSRPIFVPVVPQPQSPANGLSRTNTIVQQRRPSSSSSNDTFVSASSAPSPEPDSPRRGRSRPPTPDLNLPRPVRPASAQSLPVPPPSRRPALPQRQPNSNLPLNSLTSAIMAGSLASSRATPTNVAPPLPPPPPPARKKTPKMRQTLRQPPAKSDEDESRARSRHRKKPLGKIGTSNKHSHHEGARKRWREEITPRERKRYEGVWASNRGILLVSPDSAPDTGAGQLVANVVVRDLWARSRLPFDELAEVWDLVDTQGKGALDKSEFVVGMWLIDQRLRGRKIPRKVSDSVWGSAKGVRVMGPKGKK